MIDHECTSEPNIDHQLQPQILQTSYNCRPTIHTDSEVIAKGSFLCDHVKYTFINGFKVVQEQKTFRF